MMGCGSLDETPPPSPHNRLYDVAASATADSTRIEGVWEFTEDKGDYTLLARLEVRDGKLHFASRCSGAGYQTITVGVIVKASWGDGKITVPEAGGSDEQTSPGPNGKAPLICTSKLNGPGTSPYVLENKKLETLGYTFTKVTD